MFIIGERINGMYKDVHKALVEHKDDVIIDLAKKQVAAGAQALDINVGPASEDPMKDMQWLVEVAQKATDARLCIDTTKADVMEKCLSLCKQRPVINSTTGQKEKLDVLMPLAKKYNASIIGLTMTKSGIPQDAHSRIEIATQIIMAAQEQGVDMEDLYIDAVILPVNVAQPHAKEVLDTIRQIKVLCDPSPKTVLGLSNVSQGTPNRPLINRTYLTMAVAAGLDAAIVDPMDKELMDEMITAELLMEKAIYCDSYIDAYKKK
jgi:5-methyltetrahydrofolate corrinoid/iron sulfur protein methyltransferase